MTRNPLLRALASVDPTRLRSRTVEPECGKGRKRRPRKHVEEAQEAFADALAEVLCDESVSLAEDDDCGWDVT